MDCGLSRCARGCTLDFEVLGTSKGSQSQLMVPAFGYKNHINIDERHGPVRTLKSVCHGCSNCIMMPVRSGRHWSDERQMRLEVHSVGARGKNRPSPLDQKSGLPWSTSLRIKKTMVLRGIQLHVVLGILGGHSTMVQQSLSMLAAFSSPIKAPPEETAPTPHAKTRRCASGNGMQRWS